LHTDSTDVIRTLQVSLSELIEAHEEMGRLLDEERQALVHLELDKINACARAKAELAQRIQQSETQRQASADALAATLSLTPDPSTGGPSVRLGQIIDALPEPRRGTLPEMRERLREIIEAVTRDQSRNQTLTQRFLGLLNGSMEAVYQAVASLALYTTKGEVGQTHWRGCVVRQTA
jgi:flagellar biosynthesis/type III secretory pathway chaperone